MPELTRNHSQPQGTHRAAVTSAALASGGLAAALFCGELFVVAEAGAPRRLLGLYPLALWSGAWFVAGVGAAVLALLRRARGALEGVRRSLPWTVVGCSMLLAGAHLSRQRLPDLAPAWRWVVPAVGIALVFGLGSWLERWAGGALGRWLASPRRLLIWTAISLIPALAPLIVQPRGPERGSLLPEADLSVEAVAPPADELPAPRLLILGLDGARWEILEPLLATGRMPHLASLVARGRRGVLRNPDLAARTSPVAWTSLFTGQPPEVHGITGWHRAGSSLRRAASLWEILDGLGWATLTLNVPATFPAEDLATGAMVAGEPMLDLRHGTSSGWWLTTERDTPPDVARTVLLELGAPGAWRTEAHLVNDYGIGQSAYETSSGILLRAAGLWHRRPVQGLLRRLAPASLRLDLSLLETEGPSALLVGEPGIKPVALVDEGTWSPWLRVRVDGASYRFRLRPTHLAEDRAKIAVSPLHRVELAGLTSPAGLARRLSSAGEPYRVGPDVNSVASGDLDLAEALVSSLSDLARDRGRVVEELARTSAWDALTVVFTAPDRAQHVLWRFRQPDRYPVDERPGPEAVRRLGGAIDQVYEAVDEAIGDLLRIAGPESLIAVVSDHGAQGGEGLPYDHHEEGIYLLVDPATEAIGGTLGPELDQEDFLPVLFARLGLPGSRRWPGRVPEALHPLAASGAFATLPPPVASYERRTGGPGAGGVPEGEALERLRSLGYLDD